VSLDSLTKNSTPPKEGEMARPLRLRVRPGHWGLQGMRERAKLAGGELKIWSEFDSGTEVKLSIPVSIACLNTVHRQPRNRTAV
jgi:signal transduction histidine kinase